MRTPIKQFLFLLFLFTIGSARAQEFTYPKLASTGKVLEDFKLTGWFVKDSTSGDLNGDKHPDLAFVLEYRDTIPELRPDESENNGSPRILGVLLRNVQTGSYELLLQNNTFIPRYGEGGMDPEMYGKISISKGVLQVFIELLRGHATYKFRFQNQDLVLIGATTAGVSGGTFYGIDVNFSTGKAKIEEGSVESEKPGSRWVTLPKTPLKRLREMEMVFAWEVVQNYFI